MSNTNEYISTKASDLIVGDIIEINNKGIRIENIRENGVSRILECEGRTVLTKNYRRFETRRLIK